MFSETCRSSASFGFAQIAEIRLPRASATIKPPRAMEPPSPPRAAPRQVIDRRDSGEVAERASTEHVERAYSDENYGDKLCKAFDGLPDEHVVVALARLVSDESLFIRQL